MDIATVGGYFLSAFLQVLFDRMAKPEFINLFRKQKFDDRILEKLNWKLLILQAVLEDAENKQSKNLAVKKWLDELQEVLYQADDLLDRVNTEALRVKVESQYQNSANPLRVSASKDHSDFSTEFLKEILPKLEEIVEKLGDFEHKIGILGLTKEVESKKQPFRSSTSLVDENDVYGRDADKENIIQALLSDAANGENVSVISIVGLGGVGKTTLARIVYNDARVMNNEQFDAKAWVCISEEYDAARITKELLKELSICSDSDESFNSLQVKLKQGLSKKKFLLVLDDIWNRDYTDWLALCTPFIGGKLGSKIIGTTRDEKVALMMGSRHIYHLNILSEEDSWSLFKKHALKNRVDSGKLEFELIGRDIVKKCGGLPLAVKAVAGLLRSKETIEEWNEILRSEEWDQTNNQAGILPSLKLSYNHLSSHLKRCFAYCAVFHKDYRFSKEEVILLWMANDLLDTPTGNKRLEDIGDEFFRELRFRSLFQQSSDGKFGMHDLVNDLAKFVSGKYFLRLEDPGQQNCSMIVVRHFSYIRSDTDVFEKFKHLNESKFLRTFLPIDFDREGCYTRMLSRKFLQDILPLYKSLRVLSLFRYAITELPDSFADLKQLRFLDLSFTRLKKLQSLICTFYNLQTLLLAHCRDLEEFPEDMEKLINLRCLDVSGIPLIKMPLEIGRLENLQSLSTFIVSKCSGSRIEELGKLCNLHGEFTIDGLENVAKGNDASKANMKGKKAINELVLKWRGGSNDSQLVREVFESLQPHPNIEHLVINGYCGTRFPNWLEEPLFCRMISLCLSNCENCFSLPAIGQLSSLRRLTITGLSKVMEIGEETCGNILVTKPFPCLKELRIVDMGEWREWHIPENGVFSCLEELDIVNCPKFIGKIPKQLPSLRQLTIDECPRLLNSEGRLTIFDSKADSLEQLCSLCYLRISRMANLKELSSSEWDLSNLFPVLVDLDIWQCQHLVSFPVRGLPTTLKKLSIEYIDATDSIKNLSNQNLTSLQSLTIVDCNNIMSFPVVDTYAPNLVSIYLSSCPKLKCLPERMHIILPSLRGLKIFHCPEIECFPDGGLPSSLQAFFIGDCERLWSCHREWGLQKLLSLVHFDFSGTHEEDTLPPEDLQLPSTLRSLYLWNHKNLRALNYGVLQSLTCLESLSISSCPNLKSLPEEGLPSSLSELEIEECPLLKQRLEWEKGEDWPAVAHVPCIRVDDELIP